ncbi:MAG: chorismate-binding protein, partial [Geodermatophilaceae bacterium]|nr:chorismate-binding protein [Geodermatophilaceae bacterium]
MVFGTDTPTLAEFEALGEEHRVVPVTRRLLADGETPVGVYRKLAGGPGTFLLESAEQGRSWSRYSFVGVRCPAVLTEVDGRTTWVGQAPVDGLSDDPLLALRQTTQALRSPPREDLPPLTGGLVGYVAYDAVRRLERLPATAEDDLGLPDLAMMLATDVAVLDHSDGSILLVVNILPGPGARSAAYDEAIGRLDAMTAGLAAPTPPTVSTLHSPEPTYSSRTAAGDYPAAVEQAKREIRAGEAFQVVLSQRFGMRPSADPLDVYRVLRTTNPSPYMYLLRFPDGIDVVGSSPEALVTVTAG